MCEIGLLITEDFEETLQLVRGVFMQYEAPDYSQQGVDSFLEFIEQDSIEKGIGDGSLKFWVGKDNDKIVGALCVRNGCHISMLFVDGLYHRRGIATRLLRSGLADCSSEVTVNSSPYGADFYRAVGFVDTASKKEENGIVFIPMVGRFAHSGD